MTRTLLPADASRERVLALNAMLFSQIRFATSDGRLATSVPTALVKAVALPAGGNPVAIVGNRFSTTLVAARLFATRIVQFQRRSPQGQWVTLKRPHLNATSSAIIRHRLTRSEPSPAGRRGLRPSPASAYPETVVTRCPDATPTPALIEPIGLTRRDSGIR